MSNLRLHLEYHVKQAGIAGAIGALVLAFVPGYYWTVIRPLQAEADSLTVRYESARILKASGQRAVDALETREARIRAFHGFFPIREEVPGWMSKIYAAADAEKLPLTRGEYRRVASADGESPVPLRISLPVKGKYDQIRRFLTAALADVPMLALEEVLFQRQNATDVEVEAEIRLILYVAEP